MADPDEGVAADGTIRTGAHRDRVPAAFEPVLTDAVAFLGESGASLYVYGSVANGTAHPGSSDVDLLSIGLSDAAIYGRRLSARYANRCRGVELLPPQPQTSSATPTRYTATGSSSAITASISLAQTHPLRYRHFRRTPGLPAVSTATSASIFGDGGRTWSPGRWLLTCSVNGLPVRRSWPWPDWSASTTTPGRPTDPVLSGAGVNSSPASPPNWVGYTSGPRESAIARARTSSARSRTMESSLRSCSASVA